MEEINIPKLYVCDRKRRCNESPYCGKECRHTANEAHALYDPPHIFGDYKMEIEKEETDGIKI